MTTQSDRTETLTVSDEEAGLRLDQYLAGAVEDASRSFLKKAIKDERVRIAGTAITKPSRPMAAGDCVEVTLPPPPPSELTPENIPLDILHEDADVLVVNKPSGMVVHPAPGHYTGTLVHAVLYHCPDFQRPTGGIAGYAADPGRPGIVHRLDRDTSGVMVVAKTQRAFDSLAKQAREHTFDRRYLALVRGEFPEDRGVIDAAIGRSLVDRSRMAVTGVQGRDAVTHFEVLERFGVASLVACQLETGRTHQIRVHLRYAGRPVLGDPVYGVTDFGSWKVSPEARAALEGLTGQALHAERLGFVHPATGETVTFTALPPPDFQRAVEALRSKT